MNRVLHSIRNRRMPSVISVLALVTVLLSAGFLYWEPRNRSYVLYLSTESCPLLSGAGITVSWSEDEGCRYLGPARQLLSNWKIGDLVIAEQAVIAFRKDAR